MLQKSGITPAAILLRCFTFLLMLMLVYSGFIFAFSRIKLGHVPVIFHMSQGLVLKGGNTWHRFQSFEKSRSYDILIFGSSRANRGIDPAVLEQQGWTAYNLGTDDQTPVNTEVMIRHFVCRSKPRLVVIDVFHLVFTINPLPSSSDIIINSNDNALAFRMLANSGDIRMLNSFAVHLALGDAPPAYTTGDTLYNGFRIKNHIGNELPADRVSFDFKPSAIASFDRSLEWLEEQGIPVLLVAQPEYPGADKRYEQAFATQIQPVLQKHKLSVFNLHGEEISLGKSCYSDYIHLNVDGARNFTASIAEHIHKAGLMR